VAEDQLDVSYIHTIGQEPARAFVTQVVPDWESNLMPLDRHRRQGGWFNPP
jgi:hypothetical protein